MELGLKGKHVIVTGGGSNIGRAIVHAFAAEGSHISIAELVPSQGKIVAGEVAAMDTGSRVKVIETDVTDPEKVARMVEQAIEEFGPVDVLVNNVGWTVDRLFMEKPRQEWEREVQVNLWGAINCIHAVLPGMIESQAGAIVCISSDAGRMGEYREAVYSACKAGVIALSKSVARETGPYGLRLNVVCPGLVVPPDEESISEASMWNQMREIFTEEDFSPVVDAFHDLHGLFLCSSCGHFIQALPRSLSTELVKCDCGKVSWNLKQKTPT